MRVLGVNVDHVATLRQARLGKDRRARHGEAYPSPLQAALVAVKSGADSIVAHLREDRRHIQDYDIFDLKKSGVKLNMELSIDPSVLETAYAARPHAATFVPEKRQEKTTESGLDAAGLAAKLAPITAKMRKKKIAVSLFIGADTRQIDAARDLGARAVEIHTGEYACAASSAVAIKEARRIAIAVRYANSLGLLAHVGHGLDYKNVRRIAAIPGITEFNIGYSIVSRALYAGFADAVRDMKRAIRSA
jgi:pyridoxine 5-phosphate synthase